MRFTHRLFITLAAVSCIHACDSAYTPATARFTAWGKAGLGPGMFRRPRAIGVSGAEVYVIDTTGRVQVFDFTGTFLRGWSVPESENGTPTAVAFDRKGRVLVPDTHYSRILEYTSDGTLVRQWGSYGTGKDEFVYPTGIARAPDGTYYVSEYGMDAERVHVFYADRRFLRQWGGHGEARGQFNRAMDIELDADGTVYVVDTANHRIQCFDTAGTLLRVIGAAGTGPGQLKFPYDIAIGPDGSIYVCEYGNHRVSRFSLDGEFIAVYGRPGRGPGEFNAPRGIAVADNGIVFVADTDNDRVQRIEVE